MTITSSQMRIFGEHDQRVIDQLARCAAVEED